MAGLSDPAHVCLPALNGGVGGPAGGAGRPGNAGSRSRCALPPAEDEAGRDEVCTREGLHCTTAGPGSGPTC